jgi:hypothetical protein
MKVTVLTLMISAAALLSVQASADDAMTRATPNKHQMIKDCIQKQKTADVNMSKSEMVRICKAELKQQKTSGVTPPPPSDAPHN